MTPRVEGEYRKGDVFYLDRHFKLKDIEAAIATKAFAAGKELGEKQALERVDRVAEELGRVEYCAVKLPTGDYSEWWEVRDGEGELLRRKDFPATFTQAILSTEGA